MEELSILYKQDQKDRRDPALLNDPDQIIRRDKTRRLEVRKIMQQGNLHTARDFYIAALILHHGLTIKDSRDAARLARQSMKLGYIPSKWLHAACIDRLLRKQGKKQKFGTQYYKKKQTDPWRLAPVDPTITDEERAQYNVMPLAEMKKFIRTLNVKKE